MRRRVLIPSVLLGLITVIVILVTAGHGIAVTRTHEATLQRMAAMNEIVSRAEVAVTSGETGQLQGYLDRFAETYGDAVAVIDGRGAVLADSGGLDTHRGDVTALALSAGRSVPRLTIPTIRPWSDATALLAAPFEGLPGVTAGAVVVETNLVEARTDVTTSWALITLIGFVLLGVLLLALYRWTNWILRPVHALDRATHAIEEHRAVTLPERSGPPELRRLARSFARMAGSVEDALEQQRGFVAEASHQLRNPLAAIRLRIDGLPPSEETRAVDGDLDRLEHIVDRMLVLANAEHRATAAASGGAPTSMTQQLDLTDRANAAEVVAAAHAPDGLRIRAIAGERVPVLGAFGDLVEITEILLENAAKYAGEAATVTVSLRDEAGSTVLEVGDDGPGLDADDLAQVGNRFWRSDRHRGLPGTGLGLTIVRQLALAHDGDMRVSRSVAGGLLVRVEVVPQ
ncbi:sensor histidine kinase [Gulosibacter sp. ACHW.36C]|uniref:histidine kinase n=1 Tax=Gulosibacter sediminis TaxID=1729695 RepID=A0ABY4N0Z0_9MICO|nr:HAMP domain-containing sensor histidine kinase [Gulosibacter sediminis]UQN15704.1 HAMP domain-containing histidine kinase [Gulosibacter sediminis]